MKTRHKHAALIVEWAAGAEIQLKYEGSSVWHDSPDPSWSVSVEYRVKPEAKPNTVVWFPVLANGQIKDGRTIKEHALVSSSTVLRVEIKSEEGKTPTLVSATVEKL